MNLKKIRFISWLLVMVSIFFALGIYLDKSKSKDVEVENTSSQLPNLGGDFSLINQDGKKVSNKDFRGKYMLVFFGFTNCPSICPPALANMTVAMERLGNFADDVVPVFITVDPERDTPEQIKSYLTNFDSRMVGLTGTKEQLKELESAYKVYSSKVEDKQQPDGYIMDHSGIIYLMDKRGKYIAHYTHETDGTEMAVGIIKEDAKSSGGK